ncbi:MAG: MOSC domain-containing protein [Rhodospirillales bacterium]|nr:MOSC domain-containing protein [Rhodospirillales bacterium]
MKAQISKISRYPVKGLSPQTLSESAVDAGGAIPGDRRFALALGSTLFDGTSPHWLPKTSFLALMKNEKLAALETVFDDQSDDLQILRNGKQVAHGKLSDPIGRAVIEDFFSAYMRDETRGKPRLVESIDGSIFTDQKRKVISVINLASVRDLERVVGTPIDPFRFRANIYIDGIDPWAEFNWIDKGVVCGSAGLIIKERTERCTAINVDPQTGERNMNLLKTLQGAFGHVDLGVFAMVSQAGSFAIGDPFMDQD